MQNFITLFLFICCIILFCIVIFKKYKNNEINNNIKEENNKLEIDRLVKIKELESLDHQLELKQMAIKATEDIAKNMKTTAYDAYTQYQDLLNTDYEKIEQEHDQAIDGLRIAYDNLQDILILKIKNVQKDLDKITSTRAAAMKAQLKEQEIKDKQSFYCPQIPQDELKDAKTLRDIEYKLNNPRILRMLIWQSFYQKPINQVCANVLGAATATKCGIYKITNQKNNLVYIGQAVDIATRWKNHAKAGLGIDTPANNKLYKAMMEDGLESFSFEVLEECSRDELNEKEKFYISLYQSDQYGYNSNSGINKS